jgi:hypothetical protein
MRVAVCLLLVLTLFSCGSDTDVLKPIVGDGHFRGNSIGDKYKKVSNQVAADNPVSRSESAIGCELNVDGVELTVQYEFDGDALYSIQADMFFEDSTQLSKFQGLLIERYNSAYGEMSEDGGFLVWQENNRIEFTLADESIEFGQPMLSLTIYNFDY